MRLHRGFEMPKKIHRYYCKEAMMSDCLRNKRPRRGMTKEEFTARLKEDMLYVGQSRRQ